MKVIDYCPCCNSRLITKKMGYLAPFLIHRIFNWPIVPIYKRVIEKLRLKFLTIFVNKIFTHRLILHMQSGVIVCSNCHFICSDVRFDEDEMAKYYDDFMGESYTKQRESIEPGFAKIRENIYSDLEFSKRHQYFIEFFNKILRDHDFIFNNIFDYGGGDGKAIPIEVFPDSKIYIYDISNKSPATGLTKISQFDELPIIDLAFCTHVLEHVSYPADTIRHLAATVKQSGFIYIEVPKELPEPGSEARNQALDNMVFHEHFNHFHEKSVTGLCNACGLEVLLCESFKIDIGWTNGTWIRCLAKKL